jgi:hypothetical protein
MLLRYEHNLCFFFEEVPEDQTNGDQQLRSLGTKPRSKLPITVNEPVLNAVTCDNGILADPVEDFGPCLNDEGETRCTGEVSGATLQSLPSLAGEAGDISNKSWTLSRSGVCAKSLVLRTYNRTATGVLRRERDPELFSRCGRAGNENGAGYWDVAQNHTQSRTGVAASYQAGAFPLTGPDDKGELSSKFHPRRWRCLMKTRTEP